MGQPAARATQTGTRDAAERSPARVAAPRPSAAVPAPRELFLSARSASKIALAAQPSLLISSPFKRLPVP